MSQEDIGMILNKVPPKDKVMFEELDILCFLGVCFQIKGKDIDDPQFLFPSLGAPKGKDV